MRDAAGPSSKWAARVSSDPFASASAPTLRAENGQETAALSPTQCEDGKENRVPLSGDHPNVSMSCSGQQSLREAELLPGSLGLAPSAPSSLLGKRPNPTETDAAIDTHQALCDQEDDAERTRRYLLAEANAVAHFEARALELHEEDEPAGSTTMFVDDLTHVGHLRFGAVALGERRSRKLTLENASEVGNARVKYGGYALIHSGDSAEAGPLTRARFKCDLHVCVVDALKAVTLRVTFEPQPMDVGREVTATLQFTVNDRFKLQCRATGAATPRVPRISRFGRMRQAKAVDTVVVAPTRPPRIPAPRQTSTRASSQLTSPVLTASNALAPSGREPEHEPVARPLPSVGEKRRSSVAIEFSPPRTGSKRRRSEQPRLSRSKALASRKRAGASPDSPSATKRVSGSWWKQRQEVYDENWMAKQTEGFTKWMNYVLLDGTAQRLSRGHADAEDDGEEQTGGGRRRFDFSSLRVLAQKRLESSWAHAAVELYHSPSMDEVLFNLQDEIGNQGLLFRADRPVYADVGLQEELLRLLNNYHPVWLCLGLYAVLGNQVMKQEKCSLRTIFSSTATRSPSRGTNEAPPDTKMPRVLRRIILKHLVKDSHVAENYRLVKNLLTPLDGSTEDRHDGGNAFRNLKKNINGREFFDSLTQSFMLKFLMLVLFLDRAIERKADAFAHFPCLFRLAPPTQKSVSGEAHSAASNSQRGGDDELRAKNSQVLVTEFCRLFLASEGRIDKHLAQLGYTLTHEQTPLDEIDLEVKNLETDLRDGVRLAKLMEALTASASSTGPDGEALPKPQGLSTFLRVPALSRLQKVHNVEICLHFLQDKCGASVLENLKSTSGQAAKKHRLSGRVRVSTLGFAGLSSRVDEKMVETLARDIVSGHREKTLALLWKLISAFQLQSLVDAETMRNEVATVVKRMSFRAKELFDRQQRSEPLVHTDEHECYALLLEWCRAVCANYDVAVSDFSSSFADGKALCYLLHYYHPMLLSKADLLPTSRDRASAPQVSEQALLSNEKRHFALVNDRIKQLGEVPVLMPQQYNTKNPPEDKMVVTFVCYLQSRLMDSCSELHAASRLKRWWTGPLIRLRRQRKKRAKARIIQRFWYTSSHKRLAIRQCRKLLRAAHVVKSTVRTWGARSRFLRLRTAAAAIQRAFRAHRQVRLNGAVLAIQRHWREQRRWKRGEAQQLEPAMPPQLCQRVRVRASCAIIERKWLQHLSREGARLFRQQLTADRHEAATRIQVAWRQGRVLDVARKRRVQGWRQVHGAARVVQRAWRGFHHRREERQRVVALQRFEQLMREKELENRQVQLKRKVETRAVKSVQKGFRTFVHHKREAAATKLSSAVRGAKQRRRFQSEKHAARLLQRTARVWRRRRQLSALMRFSRMLEIYQRMRANEAQRMTRRRELWRKVETRAVCRVQSVFRSYRVHKQTRAATRIQCVVRAWLVRSWYCGLRQSACLLQRNVRIWRRQRQLGALVTFRGLLLGYRRMQREQEERHERLRRLQESVEHRAASRIRSVYRLYASHKRMLAATLIQAAFRGVQEQRQYARTQACAVVAQRAIRSWLAARRFQRAMRVHRAAASIQRSVRGWLSRRRKRALMVRARWTQVRAALVEKRIADANKIATCWRSARWRRAITARIELKKQKDAAAQCVQVWWLGLCCRWAERRRRAEERRQREMEEMALAMAKTRAERLVGSWLRDKVIFPYRKRNVHYVAVRRLQAWWRGALVRSQQSSPEITRQRQKLSSMKLVGQERDAGTGTGTSSSSLLQLRVKKSGERSVQPEQPQTLGARLDMALHMLLHGRRLQDMLFASHTIEVCTRYSRECCRKCVQLQISSTIFAAIRGLNRSRPHVELLHQLLLVLKNLTVYRRSADKSKPQRAVATEDAKGRLDVDLRALDTLVDLLHIHRDMHHVFVLSADVITYYLTSLKPLAGGSAAVQESWSEAEKRLSGLQELLSRKLALYNATASFRRVNQIPDKSGANNLMRKMNPKTAVSIMERLNVLLEWYEG